jgi:nitrite reductase (NO-forming)
VAYPESEKLPARPAYYTRDDGDSNVAVKLLALFLGLAVGVLIPVAVWLAASAQDARNDPKAVAARAGAPTAVGMPGMPGMTAADMPSASESTYATPSFAGIGPADADAIAKKHESVQAALPAAPAGPVARVNLAINHGTVSIAPGIKYEAWMFGKAAPGPVIHVREGQLVKVRLTNNSPMPHSVDFHAAQIAPNIAFADVPPGKSKTFSFVASTPGVFMYHCGTSPAFVHIANGMYGAIVVEPKNMPPAQRQYVLVSSEWYLNGPGDKAPAGSTSPRPTT